MTYMVNTFTSIYPYGILSKGEILEQKHIDKIGESNISDLLARGVIVEVRDHIQASPVPDEPDVPAIEAPDEDAPDEDDMPTLDIAEELVSEQPEPEKKPRKRGGRKAE